LKRMSKLFEIIAFTASHESYADAVLDEIDP
jgi:TFIIF-interacting CTD phosphatase-like protein